MRHKSILFSSILLMSLSIFGCSNSNVGIDNFTVNRNSSNYNSNVLLFPNIYEESDLESFIEQTGHDGSWNNDAIDYSLIISPYYSMDGEGEIYAALVTEAIHSFCYVTYDDEDISLTIHAEDNIENVQLMTADDPVLSYSTNKDALTVTFDSIGTATFIINDDLDKAITFFVEKENIFNVEDYEGKNIVECQPGIYDDVFTCVENTTYHFYKGYYEMTRIDLADNVDIFFEDGTFIKALNPTSDKEEPEGIDYHGQTYYKPFFWATFGGDLKGEVTKNVNINITGRAIIDMGSIAWHARKAIYTILSENLRVKGLNIVNCGDWTYYPLGSENSSFEYCKAFAYRQNSDAFVIADSEGFNVNHCFARSGDDLFEVKSVATEEDYDQNHVRDIHFDYNTAWPDKCRGYGVIHEISRDISNVTFTNSICCASPATWSQELGALVVIGGGDEDFHYSKRISNIRFENMKIYNNASYPINLSLYETDVKIAHITFKNITFTNDHKIRLSNYGNIDSSYISHVFFQDVKLNEEKITHSSLQVSGNMIGSIYVS